ncbi:MAG: hypothetical protein GY903_02510 [Fuerstiella sp.]|nr:hypothetical protein [Fuerstiella sp.]MCP4853349.1 hypothetical protein [Fuerstiella sp.]
MLKTILKRWPLVRKEIPTLISHSESVVVGTGIDQIGVNIAVTQITGKLASAGK